MPVRKAPEIKNATDTRWVGFTAVHLVAARNPPVIKPTMTDSTKPELITLNHMEVPLTIANSMAVGVSPVPMLIW